MSTLHQNELLINYFELIYYILVVLPCCDIGSSKKLEEVSVCC